MKLLKFYIFGFGISVMLFSLQSCFTLTVSDMTKRPDKIISVDNNTLTSDSVLKLNVTVKKGSSIFKSKKNIEIDLRKIKPESFYDDLAEEPKPEFSIESETYRTIRYSKEHSNLAFFPKKNFYKKYNKIQNSGTSCISNIQTGYSLLYFSLNSPYIMKFDTAKLASDNVKLQCMNVPINNFQLWLPHRHYIPAYLLFPFSVAIDLALSPVTVAILIITRGRIPLIR